jgi:hypothetical protein
MGNILLLLGILSLLLVSVDFIFGIEFSRVSAIALLGVYPSRDIFLAV